MDKRAVRAAVLVFLLALPLRLWYATKNPLWNDVTDTPRYQPDSRDYDTIARNLVAGHGYSLSVRPPYQPTAKRTPAYPLFLAVIYHLLGYSYRGVLVAQVLLGAAVCVLIFWMGFWLGGLRVGVLAGLLNAFNPRWGAFYASELLSEQLAIFQFALVGFLLIWAVRRRSLLLSALAGFTVGWALLCKPALMPFLPCLLLIGWGTTWTVRERLMAVVTAFACAVAVFAPWLVRNKMVFGSYSASMVGGKALYQRTYDRGMRCDYGDPEFRREWLEQWAAMEKRGLNELQIGATFQRWGWANAKAYPLRYAASCLLEIDSFLGFGLMPLFRREHGPSDIWDVSIPRILVRSAARFILYGLAVIGMVIAIRTHRGESILLVLMVGVFTVIHLLICYCIHRYSEPIMPLVFLFSAIALNSVWQRHSEANHHRDVGLNPLAAR